MVKVWVVSIREGVDKDKVREQAPEYLSKVEQEGLGGFAFLGAYESRMRRAAGLSQTMPECVEDICYKLGIVNGTTIPGGLGPKIVILGPAKGAALDPATWRL